jgi:glycosyltransferase involved in cell wall biosynthesis
MLPLVSVLTPTRDRRAFLPQLLRYFNSQSYPADRLELIVVDDGRDRIDDLLPLHDPRVRYEHLDVRIPLGTKRNRLVELSRGDILVHMDDDDYYPPDRVERAVRTLQSTGAEVVGKSEIAFWDAESGGIHLYPKVGPKHVSAGTMAYPRAYWDKQKFAPDAHTEERQFLNNFTAKVAQLACEPWEVLLCISHGGNALPKNTGLPKLPLTLADIIPDPEVRAFYAQLDLDAW